MPTYHPLVYKSCGGDQLTVAENGVLSMSSGATLTLTGQAVTTTGALTANSLTCTGKITGSSDLSIAGGATFSSGIAASSGKFSSSMTVGGNLTVTSGLNASTGTFTSGLSVGQRVTATSGINGSTGEFSSGVAVGAHLTVTSGISATTGQFSGGVAVSSGLKATNPLTVTTGINSGNTQIWYGAVQGATAGGALSGGTHYIVQCTGAAPVLYTIEPAPGRIAFITSVWSCSSTGVIVTTTGTWDGSNKNIYCSTGATNNNTIGFYGLTTAKWTVISTLYSTDWYFSNT